jgi:2-polyprenyl-3-methyl-5-hydroxy-6-metoxy-1,4-benzoquinol methylase
VDVGGQAQAHWNEVYGRQPLTEVSWFERVPTTSLRLVTSVSSPAQAVVDVGAGASFLVDELVAQGYEDVTVLDVSSEALATVRSRLPGRPGVQLVVADLLDWRPPRQYHVWHDRAVFHFLTDEAAASTYADVVADAVHPGGAMVIGTFAQDGPTACSGLPTARYDPDTLAARFAHRFVDEHREREEHVTPSGAVQPFTWLVLRRR